MVKNKIKIPRFSQIRVGPVSGNTQFIFLGLSGLWVSLKKMNFTFMENNIQDIILLL